MSSLKLTNYCILFCGVVIDITSFGFVIGTGYILWRFVTESWNIILLPIIFIELAMIVISTMFAIYLLEQFKEEIRSK